MKPNPIYRNRTIEVLLVLAAVAVAITWLGENNSLRLQGDLPRPRYTRTPDPHSPMAVHQDDGRAEIGKIALGFSTHNLDGEIVPFPGRAGPFLCLLTFIDCDHCATRLSVQDSEAAMIAEKEGVDVIDILVYATPNDGRNFVKLYPTPSREVLCDSSGWIVKNQLGGTHEECWILLDRAGRIVHRSDADLDLLREAINGLKP